MNNKPWHFQPFPGFFYISENISLFLLIPMISLNFQSAPTVLWYLKKLHDLNNFLLLLVISSYHFSLFPQHFNSFILFPILFYYVLPIFLRSYNLYSFHTFPISFFDVLLFLSIFYISIYFLHIGVFVRQPVCIVAASLVSFSFGTKLYTV